jgi:hypothetical protein
MQGVAICNEFGLCGRKFNDMYLINCDYLFWPGFCSPFDTFGANHMHLNSASGPVHQLPFISDRVAYACAFDLVDIEGDDAVLTASDRAETFAARGDEPMNAYWRRVERAVEILLLQDVVGELH